MNAVMGKQAVVIGAGMGGLAAAGALAGFFEHVVVLERDELPVGAADRHGTPQGRHNSIILAHPCPGQTSGKPRRNFAVRNSFDTDAMAVPIAGVRFGHSTTRRRGGRRPPPREDPARGVTLQHFLQLGMNLDCKIAARLFRRCPQRVKSRIMPDSLCSSMGSAFTETA